MEIPKKLLKFQFHFLFAVCLSLVVCSQIYLAPSLIDVLAFFRPLFLSTALFLVAVVLFGRISPPVAEAPAEKAAEGLLDFVAGQPPAAEASAEKAAEGLLDFVAGEPPAGEVQSAAEESSESEQKNM